MEVIKNLLKAPLSSLIISLLQGLSFVSIGIFGKVIPDNIGSWAAFIVFFALGIWAMITMHFRFNINPEPRKDLPLVVGGPFSVIRNPMYASMLGIGLTWLLPTFPIYGLLCWFVFLVIIVIKIQREEIGLAALYGEEYREYRRETSRLIPFVW